MHRPRTLLLPVLVVFALLGVVVPSSARADIMYTVTADTSSISGEYGYLDFQFNPGGSGAALASAAITAFSPQGNLNASDPNNSFSGSVSGSLANSLTLTNITPAS